MTQPNPLTPSQEAREAAGDIPLYYCAPLPGRPIEDSHTVLQKFARFEQAIRKDEAEKCADILERRYRELAADCCEKAAEEMWPMVEVIRARHTKGESK